MLLERDVIGEDFFEQRREGPSVQKNVVVTPDDFVNLVAHSQ